MLRPVELRTVQRTAASKPSMVYSIRREVPSRSALVCTYRAVEVPCAIVKGRKRRSFMTIGTRPAGSSGQQSIPTRRGQPTELSFGRANPGSRP